MFDLVIRNGSVVDGTGRARYRADVGVRDGKIAFIGKLDERGREEIDAEGHIVAPGYIDAHTHMDAQVHWDPLGTCSSFHGITSVVMGNCGFTLAPSREKERHLIVRNLERAEDISGSAMAEGIKWSWESFPEYLQALERLPKGINYAANIGHSALRTYVMGERAFEGKATEADLTAMRSEMLEALQAGAVGFTTSRSHNHETSDDRPVASRLATWDEVCMLVRAMGKAGGGIFEISKERNAAAKEPEVRRDFFDRLQALAVETGVPITFGLTPTDSWREQLQLLERTAQAGGRMYGQSHARGMTVLMSFRTQLPFDSLPEWKEVRSKPFEEQRRLFSDPAVRQRLIHAAHHGEYRRAVGAEARKPDWKEVRLRNSPYPPYPLIADLAKERGVDPVALMIDLALQSDFKQFFIQNAVPGQEQNERDVLEILKHPNTIMTFSDTGAHVTQIADFSIQTHLLAYWVRQRGVFTLEEAVRMITKVPASIWGFADRGEIREGLAADLNVFDLERLSPGELDVAADLPTGAKRLIQKAEGIRATIVGGRAILRDGVPTGALPGKLLKSTSKDKR